MKFYIIFIFFLFPGYFFGQDNTTMSLDECLQMALSNNENLKNSLLEENVSRMTSREYLSVGFPQISFETGLKYNFEIQKSLIDISKFMPGVPEGTEQEVSFGQKYDGIMVGRLIQNNPFSLLHLLVLTLVLLYFVSLSAIPNQRSFKMG